MYISWHPILIFFFSNWWCKLWYGRIRVRVAQRIQETESKLRSLRWRQNHGTSRTCFQRLQKEKAEAFQICDDLKPYKIRSPHGLISFVQVNLVKHLNSSLPCNVTPLPRSSLRSQGRKTMSINADLSSFGAFPFTSMSNRRIKVILTLRMGKWGDWMVYLEGYLLLLWATWDRYLVPFCLKIELSKCLNWCRQNWMPSRFHKHLWLWGRTFSFHLLIWSAERGLRFYDCFAAIGVDFVWFHFHAF